MAASVPDSDSLRRAALQASWQRGRWVARRRLWWRWATWTLLRIVLPALAVLGSIGALVHGWPVATNAPAPVNTAPRVTPPAVAPAPTRAPAGNNGLRMDWSTSSRDNPASATPPAASPASATTTPVGDSRP